MVKEYIDYIISNTTIEPQNFLEIGSRDGLDAYDVARMFKIPKDKIYLVEPYHLHINYIKSSFPQYKLFECGITQQKGKFKFYGINLPKREDSGLSSFLDRKDDAYDQAKNLNALEIIEVETITGKELLDQINEDTIDMCDLDVEGMAYDVLLSFGDDISKIKTIHMECEEVEIWKNQHTYNDVRAYLESKNFVEVFKKSIYEYQLDLIYINKQYGETISPIINA